MNKKVSAFLLISLVLLLTVMSCGTEVPITSESDNPTEDPSDEDGEELILQPGIYLKAVGDEGYYISHVKSSKWESSDIVIKDKYKDGKPIIGIGEIAFWNTGVTSITIPSTVKTIGRSAFVYCYWLESVVIESDDISIDDAAFCYCTSLSSLTLNCRNVVIKKSSFSCCKSLTSINIQCSESLDIFNFSECDNLESITISGTAVGRIRSIRHNNNLKKVAIEWKSGIIDEVGAGCPNLSEVIINGDLEKSGTFFCYTDNEYYHEYDHPYNVTIQGNVGILNLYFFQNRGDVSISGNVESIEERAYSHNNRSITIGGDVGSIGEGAFYSYDGSITIGGNIETIGELAFRWFDGPFITICGNVGSIGEGAFEECDCPITIDGEIGSIGSSAFNGSGLTNIIFSNKCVSIGSAAFYGCSSLTSITIPDSVTSIGGNAFYACDSLSEMNYTGTMSQWRKVSKGYDWAKNCPFSVVHCTDGDVKI